MNIVLIRNIAVSAKLRATQRVRQILQDEKPNFIIRADIKSFYSSILHHKLLKDLESIYDDPSLLEILKRIITNPIETLRGYRNPATRISLRGPLSQFFSAIYLKSLDDAFLKLNVTYLRYQDDCASRMLLRKEAERQYCTKDEGRPLEAGIQVQASNHLMLL